MIWVAGFSEYIDKFLKNVINIDFRYFKFKFTNKQKFKYKTTYKMNHFFEVPFNELIFSRN